MAEWKTIESLHLTRESGPIRSVTIEIQVADDFGSPYYRLAIPEWEYDGYPDLNIEAQRKFAALFREMFESSGYFPFDIFRRR